MDDRDPPIQQTRLDGINSNSRTNSRMFNPGFNIKRSLGTIRETVTSSMLDWGSIPWPEGNRHSREKLLNNGFPCLREYDEGTINPPRVSALGFSDNFNLRSLFSHLTTLKYGYGADPKLCDEVIHTKLNFENDPYALQNHAAPSLDGNFNLAHDSKWSPGPRSNKYTELSTNPPPKFDYKGMGENLIDHSGHVPGVGEAFFFEFGVVVMWGFDIHQERLIFNLIKNSDKDYKDVMVLTSEDYTFRSLAESEQAPLIKNDVITLKSSSGPDSFKEQFAISHAIAQSVKLSVFERLMDKTITNTSDVTQLLARTGKVLIRRNAINKKIGNLFITRVNVNLTSNILDTPRFVWNEPAMEPIYVEVRTYLDINQRVKVLNQRFDVVADLLKLINDIQQNSHGEKLEWIVIILIMVEVVIGVVEIYFLFDVGH